MRQLIFIIFTLFSSSVLATNFQMNLKFRPLQLFIIGPNLEAEIAIGKHHSIGPIFYTRNAEPLDFESNQRYQEKSRSYGLNYYYYFNTVLSSGWFVSPFAHYVSSSTTFYSKSSQPASIQTTPKQTYYPVVGLTLGYLWMSQSHWNFSGELGFFVGTPFVGAGPVLSFSLGRAI
ncbi:MAG: DUF3575 domain-containing protein [Gammaproteobacteria bacterium]|nr:DUF3575 domain-containing protein [Gammaproteobacteria bacterium]